jgi:predicted dehydrogenase
MLKMGVIGAGIVCERHIIAAEGMDGVQPCAVADIVLEKAQTMAEKHGMRAYASYEEMLEKEELDFVVINLPHGLHREAAVYAAERKLHVFLEKPFANTTVDCDAVMEVAEKNGVVLNIGHVQRYFWHNRKAKELIAAGEIGKLVMMTELRNTIYFTEQRPKWFLNRKMAGGGIFMNYCAHSLDELKWFTDSHIKRVSGKAVAADERFEVDGNAQVFVEMEDGTTAMFAFCGYQAPGMENAVYLYGTEGEIKLAGGKVFLSKMGGSFTEIAPEDPSDDAFVHQFHTFIHAVETGTSTPTDGAYGKEIISAIESVYRMSGIAE